MNTAWQRTVNTLTLPEYSTALKGIRRGIEKESLRINGDSTLASTAHPASLGSPLTHSWITTDFAESMMEFITPVCTDAAKTLRCMTDGHRHVYRHLREELLWPASMPCTIPTEKNIKLANYGTSNVGKLKSIYREGLKNRYGSIMQTISGVHYNFSMPDSFWPAWQKIQGDQQPLQDFVSECYFGLIRNFFRLGWLIPYLFGASPAVDSSFCKLARTTIPLQHTGKTSYYLPMATSLRMSDLGYKAKAQENLSISYNSLSEFVCDLHHAAHLSSPMFEEIGVKQNGKYVQLNTNVLQEEGELYAPIRPKRVIKTGECLFEALHARGVEYVEVRSLDINPYSEIGIDLEQIHFLDVFLTYCLLKESPNLSHKQSCIIKQNLNKVATQGRDANLELLDGENQRSLRNWADDVFSDLAEVAQLLDTANQGREYQEALHSQQQKIANPALTPSARILADMKEKGLEVNELALNLAKSHRKKLLETDYTELTDTHFTSEAVASRQKQNDIEASDTLLFDDFLSLMSYNARPALLQSEICKENRSLGQVT